MCNEDESLDTMVNSTVHLKNCDCTFLLFCFVLGAACFLRIFCTSFSCTVSFSVSLGFRITFMGLFLFMMCVDVDFWGPGCETK